MKARRQFLLRITQMLSVAALLAVFTAQAQVSPATDFQAHVVRERDDPKLEQFFRKYVLSGAHWASHSITWYYSPANQPLSFATLDVITLVQTAMERWSKICDISFVYGGQSTANPNTFDRSNVVGWDGAISSSGYTVGGPTLVARCWMQTSFSTRTIRTSPLHCPTSPLMKLGICWVFRTVTCRTP